MASSRSADLLVEPILRRIEGAIPTLPQLVVSTLGRRAVVMGAITNVLHNTSEFLHGPQTIVTELTPTRAVACYSRTIARP